MLGLVTCTIMATTGQGLLALNPGTRDSSVGRAGDCSRNYKL